MSQHAKLNSHNSSGHSAGVLRRQRDCLKGVWRIALMRTFVPCRTRVAALYFAQKIRRSRDPPRQGFEAHGSIGPRLAAWFALLMVGNLPAISFSQSPCPGIHVRILNIRNSTGTIDCALFASPDGFPKEFLHSAIVVMVLKIKRTEARCDFEDIPTGTYALAVIHDENMNGKLDTNLLGIPKEGYGFSNDVKAVRGAPSFSDASFQYDGQDLNLTLSLHY